jgi:spore coat protein CotH
MNVAARAPQTAYIKGHIDAFGQAVSASDFLHPMTRSPYSDYIDVDAFIDHNILNALTKNVDALRISAYFSKDRQGKLVAGPIWDFDRSLGTPYDARAKAPEEWKLMGSDGTDYFTQGFWRQLFRDPTFKARYKARFQALLAAEFSPAALDALVDSLAASVGDAAARNFKRWPESPPKDGTHQAEIAVLKDFLRRRVTFIQAQLASGF